MLHRLSFAAANLARSGAFYDGGKDNGAPGIHSEYGPGYYAAFVFDPDGYRIEAVIH